MKLKKNDLLTLEITDITNLGFGVAKHGGEVLFISGAVTGDVVEAKIIKASTSFLVGRVERFVKLSELRTENRCNNSACRACAYKSIGYGHECRAKEDGVRAIFKKMGLPSIEILPVTPSPRECGYRNKAQYPVAKTKDGYAIGFFAPKSHRVTEAAYCPLAPSEFPKILELLRAFFERHGLSVYEEESGEGVLRHIYLRRGEVSGEILVTLVINGTTLPYSDELVLDLTSADENIVGILLNVNKSDTNVILGDKFITLYGRDYIFDTLAGVKLKITAPSFYQVNHDAAELLYAKARELAAPTDNDLLLDLYCGAGSIGLSMAKDAREVIGIEIVESAVECAKFNARENGIENASFYAGDAKDTEKLLLPAEKARGEKILPDIVVLDPPRGGSDEALLRHIVSLDPKKIVYISCNPATLARDMAILAPLGYTSDKVYLFDLFPMTGHVESVVCLQRQIQQ